jgi:TfoX/Sxy family transcriptional regulator of competence genes
MAYDKVLDRQINEFITGWENISERKMFGGTCYLLNGNMVSSVYKDYLILRLGVENAIEALSSDHVLPFDITGKPMRGWVMVSQEGYNDDKKLRRWLEMAKTFVDTLPAK